MVYSSNVITEIYKMILRLKNIATVSSGITFRSRIEPSQSAAIRIIQMKDLGEDNTVHLDRAIKVDLKKPKKGQFAKIGDIIFRSRGQKNTAALLREEVKDAIVAAPLLRVRPNSKKIVSEYLLWWINHPTSQAYLSMRAEGTMVKMVSKQDLQDLAVTLPPLHQQRKIAAFFDLATQEQHLLEKIKKQKARYAQGILMELVAKSQCTVQNKTFGLDTATSHPDQIHVKARS